MIAVVRHKNAIAVVGIQTEPEGVIEERFVQFAITITLLFDLARNDREFACQRC